MLVTRKQLRKHNPQAFYPPQIGDVIGDWDVRACVGLVDGDPISTLPDTYGNNPFIAATTKRPTFKVNILNNQPVARFNGTAMGMVTNAAVNLSGTSAITLYIVGNPATAGTDQVLIEMSSNYNSFTDSFLFYRTSANQFATTHLGNVAGADTWLTTDGTAPRKLTTVPRVLCSVYDKTQVAANEVRGYRGHTLLGTKTGVSNNTNAFGNRLMYLGARNQASLFLNGDITRVILCGNAHSITQRWLMNTYLGSIYGLEPQTYGQIVFDGDSLTYGAIVGGDARATSPYPTQLTALLQRKYAWENYGVGGLTIDGMAADAATEIDPMFTGNAAKNVIVVWAGTNDLGNIGGAQSAAAVYAELVSYCQARLAVGWRVVVATILPRGDAGIPGDFETKRQTINTSIRNGYGDFAHVLADVAADPRIGDAGDQNDTTYYTTDLVHLNDTGYGVVAGIMQKAVALVGVY